MGDPTDIPRVLIGTMSDLDSERVVTTEMGQALAAELGIHFIETSSKHGINIAQAFHTLIDVAEKDNPSVNVNEPATSDCIIS